MTQPQHEEPYKLSGFSGCTLEIKRDGKRSFVRKVAGKTAQNAKIDAEVEKLGQLARLAADNSLFSVPQIYNTGITDLGLSYYDLEFIPAWELDTRLPNLLPREIESAVCRVYEMITIFAKDVRSTDMYSLEVAFLRDKLKETHAAIVDASIRCPVAQSLIEEYADRSAHLVIDLTWLSGVTTTCHGDLALDNILIDRHQQLHLIDPLINGYETFLWDIAKVLQSSLMQWRQIKTNQFSVDVAARRIQLTAPDRVLMFNARFTHLIATQCHPAAVILYLAVILARAAKYWQNCAQLCALLILTNHLLSLLQTGVYDLDESLSPLRR